MGQRGGLGGEDAAVAAGGRLGLLTLPEAYGAVADALVVALDTQLGQDGAALLGVKDLAGAVNSDAAQAQGVGGQQHVSHGK